MRHPLLLVLCAVLFSTFISQADAQGKKKAKAPMWSDQKDAFGDPLPIGAIARIGTVRYRLPESRGEFRAVPSPDGKLLAMPGGDNDIEILELPAWTRKRVITGHSIDKNESQLHGLAFSADGKKLATCGIDSSKVYLFEVATGKVLKKLTWPEKDAGGFPFLMLSRDEQTLVCICVNVDGKATAQRVIVWDVAKEKMRTNITVPFDQFSGERPGAAVSADCRWLAQSVSNENPNRPNGGVESRIELWDLTTGKLARKIELEMPMPLLALSPDGKWLAASNDSSLLRIYEVSTGKEQHNIRGRNPIQHLQFAPDGALYVADYNGTIQRWNAADGERTASWKAPGRMMVNRFLFPPQGKMLALGMGMQAVDFWEVETGKLFSPKDLPADPIAEVAFSSQGELFVATEGGMTTWWNPRTGAKVRDLKLEFPEGDDRASPYFRREIVLEGRGTARVPRFGGGLLSLSPDSQFIFSNNGGGVLVHDARTGNILYDEESTPNGDTSFLEGGSKSASLTNKKIRIWNMRTGRDVSSFTIPLKEPEQSMRFTASTTGKHVAVQTANQQAENGGGARGPF